LYTKPPRTADGILDASRLTPGEIMDSLYTRLHWATYGGCGWAAHPDLRPELDRFGAFFVDYAWAIPHQQAPTARLVQAVDALLRQEAIGSGWVSGEARSHLATALDELQAWAECLP
jgi:hypothetical protein